MSLFVFAHSWLFVAGGAVRAPPVRAEPLPAPLQRNAGPCPFGLPRCLASWSRLAGHSVFLPPCSGLRQQRRSVFAVVFHRDVDSVVWRKLPVPADFSAHFRCLSPSPHCDSALFSHAQLVDRSGGATYLVHSGFGLKPAAVKEVRRLVPVPPSSLAGLLCLFSPALCPAWSLAWQRARLQLSGIRDCSIYLAGAAAPQHR